MSKSFYINAVGDIGGPKIFGKRLKNEFIRQGLIFDSKNPDYNICFVNGKYKPGACNVLRLDSIYFDTHNTLGDTDKLNVPIRVAYKKFDKIIFQSEWGKDLVFKHFGETNKPHIVIPNGLCRYHDNFSKPYSFPFEKILICSSRWRRHKRLEEIIKAFSLVNNKNIGLVVLGKPNTSNNISSYPERILFLGDIPSHEITGYLFSADAFVHLSWLDCSPNSVAEALTCRLPVLCNHNGGTHELVKDNGIVLRLEEDFDLERTCLYQPPKIDLNIVSKGMEDIIEMGEQDERPDLNIENVAKKYIEFIQS